MIPTPGIVINAECVRENLRRMAEYARSHSLDLRPHTKTHKSLRVAQMQLDQGAAGLTVAKAGEAVGMAPLGADLLLAYPALDEHRLNMLTSVAATAPLRIAIDGQIALQAIGDAARRAGVTIGILVDLDVGLGRTGVANPAAARQLAELVQRQLNLRLDGIMIFPGHVHPTPADRRLADLHRVGQLTRETIDLFDQGGLSREIVSGGSTPTAFESHEVTGLTEIRPGTYVYNDMNTVRFGAATIDQCAARVQCTVVSDAVPGKVIIDAGSKTLTSDRSAMDPEDGFGLVVEYPNATIRRLTEEHGEVDITACDDPPEVGQRVTLIPNHICPCVNLQDHAWWIEPDQPPEPLPIDMRGCVV